MYSEGKEGKLPVRRPVSARSIDLTNNKLAEHIAWEGCGGL